MAVPADLVPLSCVTTIGKGVFSEMKWNREKTLFRPLLKVVARSGVGKEQPPEVPTLFSNKQFAGIIAFGFEICK
jgi:hypothetical protein